MHGGAGGSRGQWGARIPVDVAHFSSQIVPLGRCRGGRAGPGRAGPGRAGAGRFDSTFSTQNQQRARAKREPQQLRRHRHRHSSTNIASSGRKGPTVDGQNLAHPQDAPRPQTIGNPNADNHDPLEHPQTQCCVVTKSGSLDLCKILSIQPGGHPQLWSTYQY